MGFWSSAIPSALQAAGRRNGKRIIGGKKKPNKPKKQNIPTLQTPLLLVSIRPGRKHTATRSGKKDGGVLLRAATPRSRKCVITPRNGVRVGAGSCLALPGVTLPVFARTPNGGLFSVLYLSFFPLWNSPRTRRFSSLNFIYVFRG